MYYVFISVRGRGYKALNREALYTYDTYDDDETR